MLKVCTPADSQRISPELVATEPGANFDLHSDKMARRLDNHVDPIGAFAQRANFGRDTLPGAKLPAPIYLRNGSEEIRGSKLQGSRPPEFRHPEARKGSAIANLITTEARNGPRVEQPAQCPRRRERLLESLKSRLKVVESVDWRRSLRRGAGQDATQRKKRKLPMPASPDGRQCRGCRQLGGATSFHPA